MFRPNQTHHQQDIFGIEAQLSPGLRKRLLESKEYAFYKEIFCRIPETLFAELYTEEPASRPNVPVNLLVGAMLLQHQHDWTFEELLDRVAFDLKVRAALGLWSLDQESFCRATLFNFQKRLRDHMVASGQDKFQAVFDRLTEDQLERFGLKGTIQRCDSTQVGSNIRDYTRIELLVEVVLRMWRVLGEAGQAQHRERFAPYVEAKTSGLFLHRLRRSDIDATLERLGELYAWMVEVLKADYGTTEIHRIVCRVFAENFTRVEERIAVRPGKEIGSGSPAVSGRPGGHVSRPGRRVLPRLRAAPRGDGRSGERPAAGHRRGGGAQQRGRQPHPGRAATGDAPQDARSGGAAHGCLLRQPSQRRGAGAAADPGRADGHPRPQRPRADTD
jgi:hypothetical protein